MKMHTQRGIQGSRSLFDWVRCGKQVQEVFERLAALHALHDRRVVHCAAECRYGRRNHVHQIRLMGGISEQVEVVSKIGQGQSCAW